MVVLTDLEAGITNLIIFGGITFMILFVVMNIAWTVAINIANRLFERSRFYFISKVLQKQSNNVVIVLFLASIYSAIAIAYENFLNHPISKIIGLLVLFSAVNSIIKIILGLVDAYYIGETKKKKDKVGVHRIVQMLKTAIAVSLYVLAALLIISIISYEMGLIISIAVIGVTMLFFFTFVDQIKNVATGTWLMAAGQINEGDIISLRESLGNVESFENGFFKIRNLDGKIENIPATLLFNNKSMVAKINEDGMISLKIKINGKNPSQIKERISIVTGKIAINTSEFVNEFKPKVVFQGIEGGKLHYLVKLRIMPFSDLVQITDVLAIKLYENIAGIEEIKLI